MMEMPMKMMKTTDDDDAAEVMAIWQHLLAIIKAFVGKRTG